MAAKQSLVCLTFDFDAISVWLARGMDSPTPVSRGEFCAVAADRVLDLLERLGLPSTWFIPGHTLASYLSIAGACTRPAMKSATTAGRTSRPT